MNNKRIVCALLGSMVLAVQASADLFDAISKSNKTKLVKLLLARKEIPSAGEKAHAAKIREKRHDEKINGKMRLGPIAAESIMGCGIAITLVSLASMVTALDPDLGTGADNFPFWEVGRAGVVIGATTIVAGAACKLGYHYWSQAKAKRKYKDACFIDDVVNGRRDVSDDSSFDDKK